MPCVKGRSQRIKITPEEREMARVAEARYAASRQLLDGSEKGERREIARLSAPATRSRAVDRAIGMARRQEGPAVVDPNRARSAVSLRDRASAAQTASAASAELGTEGMLHQRRLGLLAHGQSSAAPGYAALGTMAGYAANQAASREQAQSLKERAVWRMFGQWAGGLASAGGNPATETTQQPNPSPPQGGQQQYLRAPLANPQQPRSGGGYGLQPLAYGY